MPEADDCGSTTEHLQPSPAAEELCINALRGSLKLEQSREADPNIPNIEIERDMKVGGLYWELALHPSTPDEIAAIYFTTGAEHFNRANMHPNTKPKTRTDCGVLLATRPFFEARKFNDDIDDEKIDEVRSRVADVAEQLADVEVRNEYVGHLCRVGAQLLILRQGVVSYPTTFRESCNGRDDLSPEQRQFSHTAYLLEDDVKIKLRVNGSKLNTLDGRGSVEVPLHRIIRVAVRAIDPALHEAHQDSGELTANVLNWAIAEAKGESIVENQATILDEASEGIFKRIDVKYLPLD